PAVPILLGLVLGRMAETNFRRALMVSRGSYSIFVSSPFCIAFLALTVLVIGSVILNKIKGRKKANG
ncbi:MAG: C4-dicarboxylate ABC transporter permease, partial [Clostridia bacterium]|nr:C4-dicarboxylate ABC transporter permease [Clostridia bacterium]